MGSDEQSAGWAQFENDLWIERRLNMNGLIEQLDDADELRGFLEFLSSECSGLEYTNDRQWGELLNLMQISRKLNHRSVKLGDLMSNRRVIEANKRPIRKLNNAAKLAKTIEASLLQLDDLIAGRKLRLVSDDSTSDFGTMVQELEEMRTGLRTECWPLVRAVRSAMTSELILERTTVTQLEIWDDACRRRDAQLVALDQFFARFQDLERDLAQLRPLLCASERGEEYRPQSRGIESCESKFYEALSFRARLIVALRKLSTGTRKSSASKKHTGVRLSKLLNAQSQVAKDVMYDELLARQHDLELCKSQLDKILSSLRLEFGRFYFISDSELLTIVSLNLGLAVQSEQPQNKRLLAKLFNNSISSLIVYDEQFVSGIKNSIGEEIRFSREDYVPIRKKVNVYSVEIVRIFNEVSRKLRKTLRIKLLESLDQEKINWDSPAQMIELVERINFTKSVETSLTQSGLQSINKLTQDYEAKIYLLEKIKSSCEDHLLRFKCSTLVGLVVGFISTLAKLKAAEVSLTSDWIWQQQVRYYIVDRDEEREVEVRLGDSKSLYKFDYLPVQTDDSQTNVSSSSLQSLICTRTTQSCMLVASYAVGQLGLGANPFGPAGSGKTETIKALGHLLGSQVIVHNCDDSNEFQSLARLILGLAHTGLWGCFDEFNRLSASTMSLVSGLLERIQDGLRQRISTVQLSDGELVCVDPSSAFFVTLNPGDDVKYRGRRQMPANIRDLFLPIAMTQTEVAEIVAELLVTLSSESNYIKIEATESQGLAKKFDELMSSMSGKMDSVATCCWDLRLAMAVLRRFAIVSEFHGTRKLSNSQKFGLSIAVEVSPRLSQSQATALAQELEVLFGVRELRADHHEQLTSALVQSARAVIDGDPSHLVDSAVKLWQQLETRTGVLLLGPRGSGKTSIWRLLGKALVDSVRWFVVNPRIHAKKDLFGCFDSLTGRWVDGLLIDILRQAHNALESESSLRQVWIVLDGPIDPDWIEQLNSVLDDNKVLTLGSGERIGFCPATNQTIKLIFEAREVGFASPATISRLGLVLLDKVLGDINGVLIDTLDHVKMSSNVTFLQCGDQEVINRAVKLLASGNSVINYSCSSLSRAEHLIDVLARYRSKQLLVIRNAHLIQSEDGWNTRTFVQLLKFIATYGFYYDGRVEKKLDTRILVTSNDSFEPWIPGCSSLFEWSGTSHEKPLHRVQTTHERVLEDLSLDLSSPIVTLNRTKVYTCSLADVNLADWPGISELSKKQIIKRFGSTDESIATITTLEDLTCPKSASVVHDNATKIVFVLNDHELAMMEHDLQSRFYHALNSLKNDQTSAKLIHLSIRIDERCEDVTCWSSFGPIYDIVDELDHSTLIDVQISRDQLTQLRVPRVWLRTKLLEFANSGSVDAENFNEFNRFLEILFQTISSSFQNLDDMRLKLTSGFEQIVMFESSIRSLESELQTEQEEAKTRKCRIAAKERELKGTLDNLTAHQSQVSEVRLEHQSKSQEVEKRSKQVELELARVASVVEESKENVGRHLRPEALNEIKSLRMPPNGIKDVLDVLFILLNVQNTSWPSMKSYLARVSLRDELAKYDFHKRLNQEILVRVEAKMKVKRDSFVLERAAKNSSAIVPIVQWIEAARVYGRVLADVAPLEAELTRLQLEMQQLEATSAKLAVEETQLDSAVRSAKSDLEQMRRDLATIESLVTATKQKIKSAKAALGSVSDQKFRWQKRLTDLESESKTDRLVKLSALAAYLAIYHRHSSQPDGLLKIAKFFEFDTDGEGHILSSILCLIQDPLLVDSIVEHSEIARTSQLLTARLLTGAVPLTSVPFLNLGQAELSEYELIRFLSFGDVLCQGNQIEVIRCGQRGDTSWRTSASLAADLGKLALIWLDGSSSDLDVAELISSRKLGSQLVLAGRYDHHVNLSHFVRVIDMTSEFASLEEIEARVSSRLIAHFDPELNGRMETLASELIVARTRLGALEGDLLRQLAGRTEASAGTNTSNDEGLVELLDRLRCERDNLDEDIGTLDAERNSLRAKQGDYTMISQKAARFYVDSLAGLGRKCRFYNLSVDRYVSLLLADCRSTRVDEIDLAPAARFALAFTRPEDRHELELSGGEQAQPVELRRAMRHLLLDPSAREPRRRSQANNRLRSENGAQLVLIVHEPTRSSPLAELDEVVRRARESNSAARVDYRKVYASADADEQLERELVTALGSAAKRPAGCAGCLCVANAHLATRLLNTKLPGILDAASSDASLVLVLESTAVTLGADVELLSLELIERALLRFWYDDLALEFARRFDVLVNSIARDRELAELDKRVVLLHVLCQELATRARERSAEPRWSRVYSFGTEQLRLALGLIVELKGRHSGISDTYLAEALGQRLEALIYGARLECREDIVLLERLVARIVVTNSEVNWQLLNQLRLLQPQPTIQLTHRSQLINELIGIDSGSGPDPRVQEVPRNQR